MKAVVQALLGLAVLVYGAYCAWISWDAVKYRREPSNYQQVLYARAKGAMPHDALAMAVILHKGSDEYRLLTRVELYFNVGRKAFSPWTKLMLANDFKNMSDSEFNLLITGYPGDYAAIHERIWRNFEALAPPVLRGVDPAPGESLPFDEALIDNRSSLGRLAEALNHYPRGRASFMGWYRATIEGPRAQKAFERLLPEICPFQDVDYGPVFRDLLPADEEKARGLIGEIAHCVPLDGRAGQTFSTQFQMMAAAQPDRAAQALPFIGHAMSTGGRGLTAAESEAAAAVIGGAVSCDVYDLFDYRGGAVPQGKPMFQVSSVTPLFRAAIARGERCGQRFFAQAADNDSTLAEVLFQPYLKAPDSSLRKDMVVHLVNVESSVGRENIDLAFSGRAPRTARFRQILVYVDDSKAAKAYKALATHDYMETGKRFPPHGPGQSSAAEIKGWKTFIDTYPWFPGTDDAYYRMAYAAFAMGDDAQALRTLKSYAALELLDQDAEPFMLQMLDAIGEREGARGLAPQGLARDALIARDYMHLPDFLIDGGDFAACAARTRAFETVAWLTPLQAAPSIWDDEEEEPAPELPPASLCEAYFIKGGAGGMAMASALREVRSTIVAQLALPSADQPQVPEESLQRLTFLNQRAINRAAGRSPQMLDSGTSGWLQFLGELNEDYAHCGTSQNAYCKSYKQLKDIMVQLGLAQAAVDGPEMSR